MSDKQDIQKNLIAKAQKLAEQAREFDRELMPRILAIRDDWKGASPSAKSALADDIYQFIIHNVEFVDTNFFSSSLINLLSKETADRLRPAAANIIKFFEDIRNAFGKRRREPIMFSDLEMARNFCENWGRYRAELEALPERIERNEAKIIREKEIADHIASFPFKREPDEMVGAKSDEDEPAKAESPAPTEKRREVVAPPVESAIKKGEKDGKVPLAEQPADGTDYKKMKF